MVATTATAWPAGPVWTLELEAELTGDAPAAAGDQALEPMVELMLRTRGVRQAWITGDGSAALTVNLVLAAASAPDALRRGPALARACARYASLRGFAVRDARITGEGGRTVSS